MKRLIFGDSIARGAFDTQSGGWVERLKTHFLQKFDQTNISIYNFSISSNDNRGVLKYIQHDISKIDNIEPEKLGIIIAIGTNDPRLVEDKIVVPLKEFQNNINKIIHIAQKHTQNIIIVGGFPIDEKRVNPRNNNEFYRNKDIKIYNNILQKIASQGGYKFINVRNININDLFDGLHPNSIGHQKIFEKMKTTIENYH